MYLKINDIEMSCEKGEKWERLLQRLPDEGRGALGISVRGRTFSLAETAEEYAYAHVLTYKNEEGRRIYERSLQLLFLTAVRRACLLYTSKRRQGGGYAPPRDSSGLRPRAESGAFKD